MKLFVDDQRDPEDSTWVVARTYEDAVRQLTAGDVDKLSLDNDLGAYDHDGIDVARWMVDHLEAAAWPATIYIHTNNALMREEMFSLLRSAPRSRRAYCTTTSSRGSTRTLCDAACRCDFGQVPVGRLL